MPENRYVCPACNAVLKPAAPIPVGKKIRCPKCDHVFPVVAEIPKTVPKPKKAAVTAPPTEEDEEKGLYGIREEDRPEVQAASKEKKPEVHFGDLRDRFPKSKIGPAMTRVVVPSNWMMYGAILGCIGALALIVVGIWPFVFADKVPYGPFYWILSICVGVFLFVWNSFITVGASKLNSLESYAWAMVASIMCMLEGGMFLVGAIILIIGAFNSADGGLGNYLGAIVVLVYACVNIAYPIWCIVLLTDEEIKGGFVELANKKD